MVPQAKIAVVPLLRIGNEPDWMDLDGRRVSEETTPADWGLVDRNRVAFQARGAALRARESLFVWRFLLLSHFSKP